MITPGALEQNYREVLSRIASASGGRDGGGREVTLVAVTKNVPDEAIEWLYRLGHRDFGENYAQELATKAGALRARGIDGIRWHFIGHLQTNKAKQVVPLVAWVHTVDSERLARELAKRWAAAGREGRLPVFLEVNVDAEEGKSGVSVADAPALTQALKTIPELELKGLMCIPEPQGELSAMKERFCLLRELERKCDLGGALSMGMSSDYEAAIEEGATHVRVGTALFGAR
jgi:PLP dependent protein